MSKIRPGKARGDDIILEREENVFISNRDGLLL